MIISLDLWTKFWAVKWFVLSIFRHSSSWTNSFHYSLLKMLLGFRGCHWLTVSWHQACVTDSARRPLLADTAAAQDLCLPIDDVVLFAADTHTHTQAHTVSSSSDILENSAQHWCGTSKPPSLHHCPSSSTPLAQWLKSPAMITF